MSQPAKAQEPSMEEILASIRRIIADDDTAKPAGGRASACRRAARRSAARHAAAPSAAAAPPPAGTAAPPPPRMDQRDIDAMLAGLDAPAGERAPPADDVLDLTEQMAAPAEAEPPSFQTIDGQSDVVFTDAPAAAGAAAAARAEEPRRQPRAASRSMPDRTLMSSIDLGRGRFRLQLARPDRAGAERPHARRSGAGDAAADAQVLARRQSAGHGRAHRQGRDRTRLARRAELELRPVASPLQSPREPERQRRQQHAPRSRTAAARRSGRSPARPARRRRSARGIDRGEQRDRGAARLRRHLRGFGLQRVVQHVEAEARRRASRAARTTRPARPRASGRRAPSARRRRWRCRSGRAAASAAARSRHRSARRCAKMPTMRPTAVKLRPKRRCRSAPT